jgi:pyruvate/2-oxoglutarate dehydrogenase complex dihydrolipoamide acyltransferase (E2) component
MAKRSPVHVEPRKKGWAVVREGDKRATSVHLTQAEAAKEGRDIAHRDETEFFLHAQDGSIREHNSYGEAGAAEKGGGMSESQNLAQQIQEQTLRTAQNFYGESLGRIKSQLQGDRSQLESLAEQISQEEAQAQIQEMADSYAVIEESFDQAVQDLGVEDAVSQQAQEAAGGAAQRAQDTAGQALQGAQDAASQGAGQAQEAAGQATQQLKEAAGGGEQEGPEATQAARQKAEELGVDLSQVEGSGAGGRITIRDVQRAANQG